VAELVEGGGLENAPTDSGLRILNRLAPPILGVLGIIRARSGVSMQLSMQPDSPGHLWILKTRAAFSARNKLFVGPSRPSVSNPSKALAAVIIG